jgi:hypothetical protein
MIELLVVAQLIIIDCLPQYPGGGARPPGWSWRTIDGRQCWYEGPPMMSKDRLRWPLPPPEWIAEPALEPAPPPASFAAPTPLTEFELRWWGER